jgi:hypothetical protein
MFDKNFNIISGGYNTWKSSALHAIAYDMKSQLGKKIIFLGSNSDFEKKTHFMNKRYEHFRFLSYDDENNMKTLQVIEELCIKGGIDFLFIDDIDYLFPSSKSVTDKYISFLDKISVRKIATCGDNSSIYQEIIDSKIYYLHLKSNKGSSTYATIDDVKANDFIKSLIRDEKLKNILQ